MLRRGLIRLLIDSLNLLPLQLRSKLGILLLQLLDPVLQTEVLFAQVLDGVEKLRLSPTEKRFQIYGQYFLKIHATPADYSDLACSITNETFCPYFFSFFAIFL